MTAALTKTELAPDGWERNTARYGESPGHRASIGLLALATDRVGAVDTGDFLHGHEGVSMFSTRVPMAEVATPETLADLAGLLEEGTRLLVPGSRLDVVGLSCTSGTVAVGVARVHAAIRRARPGVKVTTPIEAAVAALQALNARRISLVVPYQVRTAELVRGYMEAGGIEILRRSTFDLGGDPEMNRLSPQALLEAALATDTDKSEAIFISCTGLRTAPAINMIEQKVGKPVVTSNQALAWHFLKLCGVKPETGVGGRLYRV